MKKTTEKRLIALLMIILLLIPSLSFADIPLPITLLTGEAPKTIRIGISEPEVKKLSQFDERRTEQLNKLIRHIAIETETDGESSRTGILIDGKEVLSYLQQDAEGETRRIYSFEPDVCYTEKQEREENAGSDDLTVFLEQYLLKAGGYMDQFYTLFAAAPEAFADRARTEKTELNFSGYGKAVKRVTISFGADYVKEQFPKALAEAAGTEECKGFISGLTFSGSQKIGLLYDTEDRIVRITYDGKVGETPETLRKVALVWKCLREDDHRKDGISLKTPAIEGADKDNIALERDLDYRDDGNGSYSWDIQIDHRAGKEDKKQTRFTAKLTDADNMISGNMEYSYKRDGKNPKIKIMPEIRKENGGEYKGTLEIADYSGKIEKNRLLVHVLMQKGSGIRWPETTEKKTETPVPAENGTQGGTEETIAAVIIQKLFELPEEDLQYFSNEIPAELWRELIH